MKMLLACLSWLGSSKNCYVTH